MRLIKQATLHFQEGNSDKIYEADLCDVGQNQFVVNFRYGRRGGNLKEGTKTKSPVTQAKAESEFAKLVNSKTKKGYEIIEGIGDLSDLGFTGQPAEAEVDEAVFETNEGMGRDERILAYLRHPEDAGDWPLSRIIWRAGELGLKRAEKLIWAHMESDKRDINYNTARDKLLNYSIAWALGRCGTQDSLVRLQYFQESRRYDADVKRIALESERKLMFEADRGEEFREKIRQNLPEALLNAYENKNAEQLRQSIERWLGGTRTAVAKDFLVYHVLYQLDDELTRPLVLDFIDTAPLTPPHFRVIRHLFKAAELRLDAQVFGRIAYRFAKTKPNYTMSYNGTWGKDTSQYKTSSAYVITPDDPANPWGRYVERKELKQEETTLAYGKATRDYMRRRIWRVLRKLGQQASPNYVRMATGCLLPYKDADAEGVTSRVYYGYRYINGRWNYNTTTNYYNAWAKYIVFGHILYTNSSRYEWRDGRIAWRFAPGVATNAKASGREEAFPELWNAQPQALLHLLDESKAEEIHEFAIRALEALPDFCASLPIDAILMFLEAPYEVTAKFGFELFKKRHDPKNPDLYALVKLATCSYGHGRVQALTWLKPHAIKLADDDRLLAILLTSGYGSARDFAQTTLAKHPSTTQTVQQTIARIVAFLLDMPAEEGGFNDVGVDIVNTVNRAFGDKLADIGDHIINDLLARVFEPTHILAARILGHQQVDFINITRVKQLIASPYPPVRIAGMNIFGQLNETILLDSEELLVALLIHESEDLRKAAQQPVKRLASLNSTFATRLATGLIEILKMDEPSEGVHAELLALIQDDLFEQLRFINQDIIFDLLRAKPSAAKELGGMLLKAYVPSSQLSVLEIAELGRNEILAVREACWAFMEAELMRMKTAKQTALRTLDSDWEDTRQFAFEFFRERFESSDWTPELLVSLCDSIRHDVQQFGKRMIQQYFQEDDGLEYLIRLSEHPSIDLQLFATNYLERFASDKPEEIAKLEYYFTSVLSRVNKGGVAKARIYDFFAKEAAKSEHAATVIGGILSRQSASIAIGDRARAIDTMITIQETYPHLELALTLTPVEVRHGV